MDIVGRSGERLSAYQAVVCLVCLIIGCISVKIVHDANEVFEQKTSNKYLYMHFEISKTKHVGLV